MLQILILILLTHNDIVECETVLNKSDRWNDLNSPSNLLVSSNISSTKQTVSESNKCFNYLVSPNWPITDKNLGQITAIDIDTNDNIVIFHRGSHTWNARTFDPSTNRYLPIEDGPIPVDTVLVINSKTMERVHGWGANLFFLPHGLTLDTNGNAWLTDVALHQIFKFPVKGSDKPTMTLGERFIPGNDDSHFCKPTSIAIDSRNGDFYVADGYCNSRVIRYNGQGQFLNQWGGSSLNSDILEPTLFNIPHKVILAQDLNLVCVADRENGRIQCFNSPDGQFTFSITNDQFNGELFSISYSPYQSGRLFAINGGDTRLGPLKGFVFNLTSRDLLTTFGAFSYPHDIVASNDTENVFVVEIGPNYIWKLDKDTLHGNADSQCELSSARKRKLYLLWSPLIHSSFASFSCDMVTLLLLFAAILFVMFIVLLTSIRRNSKYYFPLNRQP